MGRIVLAASYCLLGIIGFIALISGVLFVYLYIRLPLPQSLVESGSAKAILDRNQSLLRSSPDALYRHHRPISLDEISPWLIQATLAAEDKRFYQHLGVDPLALVRATFQWRQEKQIVSGASTITQQLIKIHDPRPRTLHTKIREAILAIKLERHWTKETILETYLNRVDYGNLRIGAASAAELYFNQHPSTLSPSQAAFLAGLPNAPSLLNPYRPSGYERALRRRNLILERMHRLKMIDQETFDRALSEVIKIQPRNTSFNAPHFEDFVIQSSRNSPSASTPPSQPSLNTSLDLKLNRFIESTIKKHLETLSSKNVKQAAAVVLENTTGQLLAMVGSPDYTCETSGQFNGALAPRSPGSALKPFTYALALEKGFTAASILPDVPLTFRSAYGNYIPKNYTGKTSGPVLLAEALGNSLNIPSIYLLDQIGGPAILQEKLKALGITTLHRPYQDYGLGLTLGTGEVTLLELTNAYATLARLGQWKPIAYLQNPPPQTPSQQVFDPTAALLIASILADPENRIVAFGRSSSLQFPFPVACKTGTSTNYRDNWCIGYTPEFTVGVWVGNFDGTPMRNVTGLTGAAPIFHEIFIHLNKHHKLSWYDTSKHLIASPVDALTGGQPSNHTQRIRTLFFSKDNPPVPSLHYHPESGHLLLPPIYKGWLSSLKNPKNKMTLATEATTHPRILNPIAGTIYILDPDLPPSSRSIRIEVSLPDPHSPHLHVSSPTLTNGKDPLTLNLKPGTHNIYVQTPQERLHTWIEVREE